MRTDDLIAVLAGAAAPVPPGRARRRLLLACLIGVVGAYAPPLVALPVLQA